ncbi:MAG: tRNA (adenosine(37)-N6)-threonylcarbamoyltransferase complex ATPase subunit type 1 TsaE [Gammaproteobacteria bacterium]
MKNIILENDDATSNFGKEIAEVIKHCKKKNIEIHLEGDLGAGKTFLTRSIIRQCGWKELVKSPTYTLCEEYEFNNLIFLHIDLYRTNEAQDIDIFNLDRNTDLKKIILIEWPERLQFQRDYDLKIRFSHLDNMRKIDIDLGSNIFINWVKKYE